MKSKIISSLVAAGLIASMSSALAALPTDFSINFFNGTSNVSSLKLNNKACSNQILGEQGGNLQPSKYSMTIPARMVIGICGFMTGAKTCSIELYDAKDCSSKDMGTVTLTSDGKISATPSSGSYDITYTTPGHNALYTVSSTTTSVNK